MTRTRVTTTTGAVRAGIDTDLQHGAVVPPLHLSSTFSFEDFDRKRRHDYTRTSNPTRDHLGSALADLEGGASATITSTGMSAVLLAVQLVKPGELVVAQTDCYGGTHRLLRSLAARGAFDVAFVDLSADPGGVTAAGTPRLVWIETPSNPLLRITDIRRVAALAHACGAIVIADNTFLSPALQNPIALGADLVVHSTTKYINGHSDVVGGCVVSADQAVGEEVAWWANCLGLTGSPFDSFMTLRGVRTLFARMAVHENNAGLIARTLAEHPAVERVYYPGLSQHAGHDIAAAQQAGFGGMVSFELRGGVPAVKSLVERLTLFTLAESLGGVESLVAHPATMTHAAMPAETREAVGIRDSLVRLSVGIESAADLLADLLAALETGASSRGDWSIRNNNGQPQRTLR